MTKSSLNYPLVSIIVLNWNQKEILARCFDSLKNINYDNFEVIMVDNGSIDGSVEYVRENYPWIRVIENGENLGCGCAFNIGMRYAKGKYLVNLANDTAVDPNFVSELVSIFEGDSSIGAIQSKIILMKDYKTLDSAGDYLTKTGFLYHRGVYEKDDGQYDFVGEIFAGKGTALTFRKKVLDEIGMFDEDYFVFFEDADLCWRIWLAGYKVVYGYKSIVYHELGGAISKTPNAFNHYHSFKNRLNSLIKNLGTYELIKILPLHILLIEGLSVYYLFKRNLKMSLGLQKAIWWNIANIKKTIKKRKHIQHKIRKINDKQLMRDLKIKTKLSYYYKLMRGV